MKEPGLGAATRAHLVPFQCSISVCSGPSPLDWKPTAQVLHGEMTATALRLLSVVPRLGGWTAVRP